MKSEGGLACAARTTSSPPVDAGHLTGSAAVAVVHPSATP